MSKATGHFKVANENRERRRVVQERGIQVGQDRTLWQSYQERHVEVRIVAILKDGILQVDMGRGVFHAEPSDIIPAHTIGKG